jgi:hypothetical protein
MKKKLELQLRAEFEQYQAKAHPEDRMSFMDYVQQIGRFQGYKVAVQTSWDFEIQRITFTK